MTEDQTRTVQRYRHAARRSLTEARALLALRNDSTREVYALFNGAIESVLAGVKGLSQEEQVQHLSEAAEKVEASMATLPEKIAAAKAAILEQIDSWESNMLAKAEEAKATLDEAKEFAATRDFEAHQQQKHVRFDSDEDEEIEED